MQKLPAAAFLLFICAVTGYFGNSGASDSAFVVRKCCGKDEFLSETKGSCEQATDKPQKGTNLETLIREKEIIPQGHYETIQFKDEDGPPRCLQGEEMKIQKLKKLEQVSQRIVAILDDTNSQQKADNSSANFHLNLNRTCIDKNEDESEVFVWTCLPKCDGFDTFCLRKCCDFHESIDADLFMCHKQNNSSPFNATTESDVNLDSATHFGQPPCNGRDSYEIDFERDLLSHLYNRLEILPSGNLFLETNNGEPEVIPWNQFCLEKISSPESPKKNSLIAFVCYPPEPKEQSDPLQSFRPLWYPLLFSISSFFLLVTSVIYVVLWKDLNLPGWLQFSFINCLLVSFSLLTVLQFWSHQIFSYSSNLCRLLGYTLHFSFLSTFFWLTSMNIDLWCSFKHTPIITSFGRSRAKRRYIAFGLFSTAIPLGVTLLAVLVDNFTREQGSVEKHSHLLLPSTGIGSVSCALNVSNKLAMGVYFYGVVGILLLVNLLFFFCTVLCLRERQRETKFAHRQSTAASHDPDFQRFKLFTRLFFIMGVLWIFELLSWLSSTFLHSSKWLLLQRSFLLTDSLNGLQGVAIFAIFIWKPQTWKQLKKKFRRRNLQNSLNSRSRPFLLGGSSGGSQQDTNKSRFSSTSTKSSSIVSKSTAAT